MASDRTAMVGRLNRAAEATAQHAKTPPAAAPPVGARYRKVMTSITPEQHDWLWTTSRSLPRGLGMADIVRLALGRLQHQVNHPAELVNLLTEQAHEEAEHFPGRRNRGLPT